MKYLIAIIFIAFAVQVLAQEVVEKENNKFVYYSYTIWIGDNVTKKYTTFLRSPKGITFYDAMVQAAEKDSRFAFEYKEYSFGRFITKIGGHEQDPENNQYWMLYNMTLPPFVGYKPSSKYLSPVGVDELEVKNLKFYLFWLQTPKFE